MTIKLFDIAAAKDYERELETYDLRIKAVSGGTAPIGVEWPKYPKPPEPMVNSRDPGLRDNVAVGISGAYSGSTRDPQSTDALDFDGTSQSAVKGFESVWSAEYNADGSRKTSVAEPFSIKEG